VHWDNLTDFYLEEEVPGESPEMLVVALKGKKLFRAIDYEFVVADLDADRDRIVTWIRFYNKHFRK
jgi:hypothetical protein